MPSFASHQRVTVIRGRGTPDEKTWDTQMGGDLTRQALFYLDDRVRTGDELHSEVFDEPRIISKVNPSLMLSGVSHWEAEIMPQSEWQSRHRQALPSITLSGQGARVNVGSADHSVQHFDNVRQADEGSAAHVRAGASILKLSLWLTAALGALCILGGIVAIIWNSISPTQIEILGMKITTGHVGVAFTGLGIIAMIIGVRSANKNIYKLAALPHDRGSRRR